jgi:choline dehydrogenase-like flavoprotein
MPFHDARRLGPGTVIRCDLCVVGAGAAGIALALELAGHPLRVAMLESGGLGFRHGPQSLARGDNVGLDSHPLCLSRFRFFGGSNTRWAGQSAPLEEIDFVKREWVPHSGWPFDRAHLDPFYRRAETICRLDPRPWTPEDWQADEGPCLLQESNGLQARIFKFGYPQDFGSVHRDAVAGAANIDVYLNANATEIEVNEPASMVTGLQVATLSGRKFRVEAKHYVLAAGGIDNPRLLLASDRVQKSGLGNGNDLVGRYFMDHPYFLTGWFEPADPRHDGTMHVVESYDRVGRDQRALCLLTLTEEIMREEGLTNCGIFFVRRANYKTRPEYFSPGGRALIYFVDLLRHTNMPQGQMARRFRDLIAGSGQAVTILRRQVAERIRPRPRLALRAQLEPSPNPESRVLLSGRRDRLAMRRARVDWKLNRDDKRALVRVHELLAEEFRKRGIGSLTVDLSEHGSGWPGSMTGGKHHMGTTRMHDDPSRGVVDADCRVHGIANLYVAGSSVFPTAGYANPTLTLVALAVRLADHLKTGFGDGTS